MGSDCTRKQSSRLAESTSPQPDLTKNEFGSAQEGGLEPGSRSSPTNHVIEQVGEAAVARRGQKFFEDTEQQRLEMHPVLIPLRQVLGLPRSTGEGSRLELEVGDITRGMEMRSESSPVEESAKGNNHDVVVRVSGRQEAIAVVGLQSGALVPDGSGIERRGGHFVEEEKSREEAGLNEEQRKQERHEVEIKCLSKSRNNPRGQTLCRNRYQQKINRFLGKAECCQRRWG